MADADVEFMARFGDGLDAAVGDQYLPNPSIDSDMPNEAGAAAPGRKNPNKTDSSAYIRALRARLIELGYLGEGIRSANRVKKTLDHVLEKKIRRFQNEAGIKKDGWAGPKTWLALECLLSFENEQDPEAWRKVWKKPDKLPANKAVLRAVYCRLYAMGFFEDWDRDRINTRTKILPSENPHFKAAIKRFCKFAQELGLVPPSCNKLNKKLLAALYRYDDIVTALGDSDLFDRVKPNFRDNIEAVARIELWLLGYEIAPGKDRASGRKAIDGVASDTTRAIESFCEDCKTSDPEFEKVSKVTAGLMAEFSTLSGEPGKDIYVGKQLNNTVGKILDDEKGKKEFRKQFENLANGIFDGVKRAIRWLFRLVKKVVKFTRQFIANVVRSISSRARRFFQDVVKAFDIVYSGMTYLKKSVYQFTEPARIVFGHDRDFDQYCLMSPGLAPERIKGNVSQYLFRSKLYAAGLNIVGHLMRMAHRVLKAVSSPFGWLLALLSLSSLANSVKAIRRQVELVRQYETDIEHRQALFSSRIT